MADNSIGYTAVYDAVGSAVADPDALSELHYDKVMGKYDAAVVDLENGKPHIVKRVDNPRVNVLPELVGKGALPSGEVEDAAKGLGQGQAALTFAGAAHSTKHSNRRSRARGRSRSRSSAVRPTNSPT